MKWFSVLILILIIQILSAQIKFQPVFIDACTGKVDTLINCWLDNNQGKVFTKTKNNGKNQIIVPHYGIYLLHFGSTYRPGFMYEPIKVNILSDHSIDTFNNNNKLNFQHHVCVAHFYSCDQLADGYIKDYYRTGKLRAEGVFKNGVVSKDFIYFNREGIKIEHRKKSKKDSFYKSYYSNGKLRKEYNTFRRITQKRNSFGAQTYLKKWTKKGFTKKELKYDTSGNLWTSQTSHSKKNIISNGKVTAATYKKRVNKF